MSVFLSPPKTISFFRFLFSFSDSCDWITDSPTREIQTTTTGREETKTALEQVNNDRCLLRSRCHRRGNWKEERHTTRVILSLFRFWRLDCSASTFFPSLSWISWNTIIDKRTSIEASLCYVSISAEERQKEKLLMKFLLSLPSISLGYDKGNGQRACLFSRNR
jgi:hypothetical protein